MSQWKNFFACFSSLFFFLTFCHGLKVTGEICRYANGELECRPELISSSERRKLLDIYGDKGCIFEAYADELLIEDDFCPAKTKTANKPIDTLLGIKKSTEIVKDVSSSEMPEWSDDEDLLAREEEPYSGEEEIEEIEFHPRSAKNIIVSSDFKTAYRKMSPLAGYGAVMSKEPLKPGQIFYVWVNYQKIPDLPCIGVTKYSPEIIVYPEHMVLMSDGTWIWDTFANTITRDGEILVEPFVQEDLNIQNGDRFGVSISDEGLIHFHHNGREVGLADEGVQEELWGFVDLYLSGTNTTIVN